VVAGVVTGRVPSGATAGGTVVVGTVVVGDVTAGAATGVREPTETAEEDGRTVVEG